MIWWFSSRTTCTFTSLPKRRLDLLNENWKGIEWEKKINFSFVQRKWNKIVKLRIHRTIVSIILAYIVCNFFLLLCCFFLRNLFLAMLKTIGLAYLFCYWQCFLIYWPVIVCVFVWLFISKIQFNIRCAAWNIVWWKWIQ